MAMLAERKRKQKYSLNPRGKLWLDDSNKFGQKMLEKMGWSHGKGLGLNENGITEGIKVSYKNDSKGMGFKDRNDQWTEHEDKFSKLLENLNGTETDKNSNETKLHSLEKMSQSSRARVHYHKFTRGKDLSRYSEKDLANIFGKKSLKKEVKSEENDVESDKSQETTKNSWSTNSGSMYDYFKKKLPNFGKNSDYSVGQNGVLQKKEESESESECKMGFGFGLGYSLNSKGDDESNEEITNNKPTFKSFINSDSSCETSNSEKKKNKKKRDNSSELSQLEKSSKKKKKHKTNEETSNGFEGIANNAFDPLFNEIKVNKHSLNTIEEESIEINSSIGDNQEENDVEFVSIEKIHKKKKKNTEKETSAIKNYRLNEYNEIIVEVNYDENNSSQKKNKRKSITEGYSNEACEANSNESVTEKPEKKKKKLKSVEIIEEIIVEAKNVENEDGTNRKRKFNGIDNPNFSEQSSTDEVTPKKKKRKSGLENPIFNLDDSKNDESLEIVDNPYEVKLPNKSKKKKNKNKALENPSFQNGNDSIEEASVEENPYEVKLNGKSKKKLKNMALDNPTFQNANDSIEQLSAEENPYEVKLNKSKKKKLKNLALDNPTFQNGDDSNEKVCLEENPYEVKVKKKKKNKISIDNSSFQSLDNSSETCDQSENPFEVKVDKEKKKKKSKTAIDNPTFNDSIITNESNNEYEVKRKSKSKKHKENGGLDNPALNDSLNESEVQCDFMLNVVSTPVANKTAETLPNTPSSCLSSSIRLHSAIKRRKSVRFSDVTQERIIPNKVDLQDIENRNELYNINSEVISKSLEDEKMRSDSINSFDMSSIDKVSFYETKGLDNKAFDKRSNEIEENVASMAQTIEKYQAEVENDINEAKLAAFSMSIGEVGNPDGENEKLSNGTKLKFKYAKFGAVPHYMQKSVGAKKSYKHLIKGDIVLGFKNTNLHEIKGYAITEHVN